MRTFLLLSLATLLFVGGSAVPAAANAQRDGGNSINGREAALIWQHGTTREAAKNAVVNELESLGYANEVHWRNYKGSVSVALGVVLSVKGYISDDAIVIEKCSGAYSAQVLSETRIILARLFPGGDYYNY